MAELHITSNIIKGYLREGIHFFPVSDDLILQDVIIHSGNTLFSEKFPTHVFNSRLIFLCLSNDPLSRIKRGKFFKLITDDQNGQPGSLYKRDGSSILSINGDSSSISVSAFRFKSYEPSEKYDLKVTSIFFGNHRLKTRWKVIGIDPIVGNEEIYTLQEVHGLGVIPNLNEVKIPLNYLDEIKKEFASLISELHSSPETIIDHCRDLVISLLSAKVQKTSETRKDLGELIKELDFKLTMVKNCAEIINRFHPRRKPNELDRLDLPQLTNQDAEFAIQATFQIIKELGWTTV